MTDPSPPPIPLPERGDGSRRRRGGAAAPPRARERSTRPERPERTGRASWLPYVGAIGIVLAVAVWAAVSWLGDDDPDSASTADDRTDEDAGPGPSLVTMLDGEGDVYAVAILAPSRDTIVHVPPGTLVEVPSLDLATLRDASRDGGLDLVRHSLENLLGIPFESATQLDPDGLAALVGPLGALSIDVPERVEERESTGRVSVLVPAGPQEIAPDALVSVLEPVGDGTSLERIVRLQAFWAAYLAALGSDAPSPSLDAGVADAISRLAAVQVRHQVLPVEAIAGVDGDDELFRVVDDGLGELIARVFPGAAPPEDRIRVRILNGAGVPGISQRVQPLLVEAGGEVTLSGNADRFDYVTTQVVYYDDEHREDAEAILEAIGVGELVKSLTPLDVVDVTIVVGADFLEAHGG